MGRIIWVLFVSSLFLTNCSSSADEKSATVSAPEPPVVVDPPTFSLPAVDDCGTVLDSDAFDGWELVWEDNFDTDLSDWTIWFGGAFNNELQLYRSQNLFVENDLLYIYSERTNVSGPTNPFDNASKNFEFASGRIETTAEYGPRNIPRQDTLRYSARLRLAAGEGLWGAFWSYNDPWPTRGEIDVLEARGGEESVFHSNFHYGSEVSRVETDPLKNNFKFESEQNLTECFHIYELEWSKNHFVIRFDGDIVKNYDATDFPFIRSFFGKTHRIVLNQAVGGDFFSGLRSSDIPDESFLIVDWVKVHQR